MKLYYIQGTCSLASHILLNEMGINYTLERVDSKTHLTQTGQDYMQINPKGYVPALELQTGEVLTENIAILTFLADQDPHHNLMPTSLLSRARVLEWLGYLNSELHSAYVVFFRNQLTDQQKQTALCKLNSILKYVDEKLTGLEYLVENKFGPADAYLYVMTEGSKYIEHDLTPYLNIVAFRARMMARSSLQLALKQESE